MPFRTEIFKSLSKPHWVSQRERAATRASLVNVAHALVAQNGEAALTLGAVADAAGLARATVYGYFSGKTELLRAVDALEPPVPATPAEEGEPAFELNAVIVEPDTDADEWLVFEGSAPQTAHEERQHAGESAAKAIEAAPQASEAPASEPEQPAPEISLQAASAEASPAPVEQPAAEQTPSQSEAEPQPAHAAMAEAEHVAAAEQDSATPHQEPVPTAFALDEEQRRLQAAHLEEIARRLILPESALKEGTDAVIARLDMRVKVLEKSVTTLETRANTLETDLPKQLKPFGAQVERLQERADLSERRNLESVAQIRLAIHNLEVRLEALSDEQPAEQPAEIEPQPLSQIDAPAAEEAPQAGPQEIVAAPKEQGDDSKPHYLATARNLAKEEARQAAERESQMAEEQRSRRRRMIVAAGIAAACLAVLGALAVFRQGAHGVALAHSRPAPAHAAAPVLAPLDRLSALAAKGNADAELLVGLKYLEAAGSEKSAIRWLARAADAGNAVALNALGAIYQQGRGVKADLAMAARLYQAAAAKGNRHAMSNLAVLYSGADAQMKDLPEAARWFERSANLGYLDAQFNLAVLYERGDGVAQSLIDAYKWYAIAAASGDSVAKARAAAIATQLEPEELSAAEKSVADFRVEMPDRAANSVPAMAQVLAAN